MSRAECFIDTNILIHFKPLDEVDWPAVTNATDVVLTVPATVIHELDEHKELGKTSRLRKRAQDALRRLNNWIANDGAIGAGVTLRLIADEPLPDWSAMSLDREVPDDRVIAALLTQRLSPECPVLLVTADYGPRLKCQGRGVSVLTLSDEYRQPDLVGEHDHEVADLRRRLAVLEDREPKLRVELIGPSGRGQRLQVTIAGATLTSDEEVEKAVRDEECVLMNMLPGKGHVLSTVSALASSSELERFRADIPGYLKEYREYLNDRRIYEARNGLGVKLQCVVVNDGTAPAEGLRIILHVPDGPAVLDEEGMTKPPEQPERPVAPRSNMQMILGQLQMSSMMGSQSYDFLRGVPSIGGESRAPKITRTNSYRIEYRLKELQHEFDAPPFDPFYCVFPNRDAVTSFSIDYQIHAKNLAKHAEGQLSLILQVA